MTSYVRGPYRLRKNTVTCGRCGTKHKKNQCPKRIPRVVSRAIPKISFKERRLTAQKAATERRLAAQKLARFERRTTRQRKRLIAQAELEREQWAAELAELEQDTDDGYDPFEPYPAE